MSFSKTILDKCKIQQRALGLPESLDPRVLSACVQLAKNQTPSAIHLFAPESAVAKQCRDAGIDFTKFAKIARFVPDEFSDLKDKLYAFISQYFKAKNKQVSDADMSILICNPLYQAGMLLSSGEIDSVVAGCSLPTSDVIRAGITTVGLDDNTKTISGSFILTKELPKNAGEQIFIFADCAVVVEPTAAQLADIATSTVKTWSRYNDTSPAVAFLSFSTKGSASHPKLDIVREAHALFSAKHPEIICEGEIQFDAAYISEIGSRKAPGSTLPGKANCFIFPDLNSGNIAYKITERLGGFEAYGPLLQGLRKPYFDLSRGAKPEDIVMAAHLALVAAAK
ncbi:MAG: phosphate acyltransferase [Oligoflexales bacterium]